MNNESVIYTDGRKVKVTTQEFIVDSARYLVEGIASVRMHFIRHYKFPPFMLLVVGLSGILMAVFHVFNGVKMEPTYIADILITPNRLSALVGFVFVLLSFLWLSVLNDKYAVVIKTAEGEKNPVTSSSKAYIRQIVSALRIALSIRKF